MPTAKKTATPTPRKRAAAKPDPAVDSAAEDEGRPDALVTHDVIRPIVIAGTAHTAGDGVTLSGLDAAVLYNEGYVRRH